MHARANPTGQGDGFPLAVTVTRAQGQRLGGPEARDQTGRGRIPDGRVRDVDCIHPTPARIGVALVLDRPLEVEQLIRRDAQIVWIPRVVVEMDLGDHKIRSVQIHRQRFEGGTEVVAPIKLRLVVVDIRLNKQVEAPKSHTVRQWHTDCLRVGIIPIQDDTPGPD